MISNQQTQILPEDDAMSALADGALRGEAFAVALDALGADGQARARWHAYHLIGDTLRSPSLADGSSDLDFLARLESRLAQEPARTVGAPVAAPVVVPQPGRNAANADVFRWKVAAGFASLAAVAVIGWQVLQAGAPEQTGAALARAVPAGGDIQTVRVELPVANETSNEAPPVMLRNAQLDELLAAHNRAVGGSALQSPARLVRNVSVTDDAPR
ncbi:sigma-E factor negative regulatory protein [Xylophilus sp. GOD-11R]|uniref:sigma-E factor negative regulatory protein n=1 Tax=Xylophilus sp. GOD-11R TaxID=3089814 RepID=UPI00298BFAC7|nr:RseA family anti-sigma factor [Xylophilus sp. GOD-11R]WPB56001.1 RseA family anti-sigma factor [Xylophilus sp. GOD-11R]